MRLATIAVLVCMAAVMFFAELGSRYALPRVSHIEARIRGDERQAMSIREPKVNSVPNILLVGNSLLLRGLDYPAIRKEMAPEAHVTRFVIENTEYIDWYYGLHHLFQAGVHPAMVVLCLNLGQTVSSRTLGDYSARHLFGATDLIPAAREAGMDATRTSELILSHWSAFYASRATIRNFVLNAADPPYAYALHAIANNIASPLPPDEVLIQTARTRLDAVQRLCDQYGIPLVLLIPPALGRYNNLLAEAAEQQHMSFDYPIPVGQIGPESFADGAHLNAQGAARFTEAIASCLRKRLNPDQTSAGTP